MSLPPLISPQPPDDVPWLLPASPPPLGEGSTSPSPAPVASPPPLSLVAPSFPLPPTPAEVVVPPAYSAPPIAKPPLASPPPSVVVPIVSPPPLVAARPPTAISPPISPVSSPSLPEPPIPSLAPPPSFPPSLSIPPPPPPPLSPTVRPPAPPTLAPPPSQLGTSLPPKAYSSTPEVSPPPPPSPTPFAPSSTWLNYPPPTEFPREPHAPLYSVVKPPPFSLPLAHGSLPVSSQQSHFSTGLIVGCLIGGVLLLLLLVLGFICICFINRRRKKNAMIQEHFTEPPSGLKPKGEHVIRVQITNSGNLGYKNPLQTEAPTPHVASSISSGTFTYNELAVATNSFSEANLIGEGGFGYVHKGFLQTGLAVAVKQLKEGSMQGEREFEAEVEIISRIHHKHLVSLIGYCIAGNGRLLVYEFVPNNTLEYHLHRNGQNVLEWATRLKIAIGSAKGLAYIHEDCNPTIIHRDIKAANILLDQDFEAKVSDFGLAKSFPVRTGITHISTRVVGTFGYLAPEYVTSGKLTEKSDVYSYGVILLELITGYPPISDDDPVLKEGLVEWARPLLTQALENSDFGALVDPQLEEKYNTNEMARMLACAAACVRRSSRLRPRMSQIVRALEGDISIKDLNGGMQPGNSTVYAPVKWQNDSGSSSEYSLNPSSSSSDFRRQG
ncbi:somatic embryogenesis receptor kinase, putative [Ricinus communis]|uniref:non-specific serine/threonine protein kinase n=1 Tax=Ricinus communis TaxID=3988 RepID=B9RS56_RICCO|nr:somatic embryogenesis receptor kinase, putative [Ricinus communis]